MYTKIPYGECLYGSTDVSLGCSLHDLLTFQRKDDIYRPSNCLHIIKQILKQIL